MRKLVLVQSLYMGNVLETFDNMGLFRKIFLEAVTWRPLQIFLKSPILLKCSRTSPIYKLCTNTSFLTWKCQNKDETSREIQLVEIRRLLLILLDTGQRCKSDCCSDCYGKSWLVKTRTPWPYDSKNPLRPFLRSWWCGWPYFVLPVTAV